MHTRRMNSVVHFQTNALGIKNNMEDVFTNQHLILCFQEIFKSVNRLKINLNNYADLLFVLIKYHLTQQKHLHLRLRIVNSIIINLMVTLARWDWMT